MDDYAMAQAERGGMPSYDDSGYGPEDDPDFVQYTAEEWVEHELLQRLSCKGHVGAALFARCERCQRAGVLYERVSYTLGYAGHPGAEQTAFQLCEPCLTGIVWNGYGGMATVELPDLPIEFNEWKALLS